MWCLKISALRYQGFHLFFTVESSVMKKFAFACVALFCWTVIAGKIFSLLTFSGLNAEKYVEMSPDAVIRMQFYKGKITVKLNA